MKVNIEIDCTPLEARQFMGLPDVSPMQTAVMDKLQQQMMSNIEKISPESLLQSWFTFDPKIAERFQDMFMTMDDEVAKPETYGLRRTWSGGMMGMMTLVRVLEPNLYDKIRSLQARAAQEKPTRQAPTHHHQG